MTILLYHYYVVRRKNKDWGDLERFEGPQRSSYSSTSCLTRGKRASVQSEGYGRFYPSTSQLAGTSSTATARSSMSKESTVSGSRASVSSQQKGSGRIKRWDSRGSRSSTKSCPPMYTYPQQVRKIKICYYTRHTFGFNLILFPYFFLLFVHKMSFWFLQESVGSLEIKNKVVTSLHNNIGYRAVILLQREEVFIFSFFNATSQFLMQSNK